MLDCIRYAFAGSNITTCHATPHASQKRMKCTSGAPGSEVHHTCRLSRLPFANVPSSSPILYHQYTVQYLYSMPSRLAIACQSNMLSGMPLEQQPKQRIFAMNTTCKLALNPGLALPSYYHARPSNIGTQRVSVHPVRQNNQQQPLILMLVLVRMSTV